MTARDRVAGLATPAAKTDPCWLGHGDDGFLAMPASGKKCSESEDSANICPQRIETEIAAGKKRLESADNASFCIERDLSPCPDRRSVVLSKACWGAHPRNAPSTRYRYPVFVGSFRAAVQASWLRVRASLRLSLVAAETDFMVPGERAARIAGIPRRKLAYWEKTRVVEPNYHRRLSPRVSIRLYDLQRLSDLLVAVELRRREISLQHIREVLAHLRARGYRISALNYQVVGNEILYQDADEPWEGSRKRYQPLLPDVLDLEPIKLKVQEATRTERREVDAGRVVKVRNVISSKPVFAGTRIPVEAVWEYLDYGKTPDEIREAYPRLTQADLDKAVLLRSAARALKQGEDEATIRDRYGLTDEETRSIRQLIRAA